MFTTSNTLLQTFTCILSLHVPFATFFALDIRPPPTFYLRMICLFTVCTWLKNIILPVVVASSWIFSFTYKAPSMDAFPLIVRLCSCACNAFTNSTKEMLDKSFVSSNKEIFDSYLSGTKTNFFYTILSSEKSLPRNVTLLTMPNNLSAYSFMVSASFIFSISNSSIMLSICMFFVLSFPSYSFLM
jgi:hypothetical protein